MNRLDKAYWSHRYRTGETGWDIGSISTPLKAYIDQLPESAKNSRILIPGAGNAYEAEYLWEKGFSHVFVVDIAAEPLQNFQNRIPHFPPNQLIEADFFDLSESFDLVIEQTFFCALHPQLRPNYARQMHQLLVPGGKLVGVLFDAPMNNDRPPFGGSAKEYRRYFDPYFRYKHFSPCYNSIPPRQGSELFICLERF
ncbi:MAG: methyltransferase domain-containing protein [Cytophagales bacterium]|nr:TPMT family class I SAM-dependent methyltransferase [Bernardetiaceae bacterium]MDW8205968.1 methyltransferase domain-containing protein [Cytophagales bacterium]